MEDKTGRKGFSAALGAPTRQIKPWTLEGRIYVERRGDDPPFEYRITEIGDRALSKFERRIGKVEFR